ARLVMGVIPQAVASELLALMIVANAVAVVPTWTARLLGRTEATRAVGTSKLRPPTSALVTTTFRFGGLKMSDASPGTIVYGPGGTEKEWSALSLYDVKWVTGPCN